MTSLSSKRVILAGWRWLASVLVAGVVLAFIGTWLQGALSGSRLERSVSDLYFRLRPRDPDRARSLERVTLVEIDDESVSPRGLGRFSSWPRTHLAEVVAYLDRAGATAIGLDLLLAERDPLFPQDDDRLVASVRTAGNVVLASCVRRRSVSVGDPVERLEPFAELASVAARQGIVNLYGRGEDDRSARRYPFTPDWEGARHPSFAAALVEVAEGEAPAWPPSLIDYSDPASEGMVEGRSFVQVLGEARALSALEARLSDPRPFEAPEVAALAADLDLPSFPEGDREAALREALRERLARPVPWLAGKLVIIGPTATGLGDLYEFPHGVVPGPRVHAAAAAQLLRGTDLLDAPRAPIGHLLLALVWCLGLAVLALRTRGWIQGLTVPAGLLLPLLAGGVLLVGARLVVVPLGLSFAGAAAALAGLLLAVASERRAREEIRETFGRYLSPMVVEELARCPERARPGGELREITLLTADVRGFTTLSERLDPAAVTGFLNRYFEEMVEELWAGGATVDKFMGDGLLAFFNAPMTQPDHALRAVRTALSMVARAERLSLELTRTGAPGAGFAIGVAINTGTCLVGNIGASRAMGYTAIGDAVNTAARIEGLNSRLGTTLLLGESTAERVRGVLTEARLEPIGSHKLKGKRKETRIYTVASNELRRGPLRHLARSAAPPLRRAA